MKGRTMKIDGIDHIAVTVADMARSCDFYARVLGGEIVTFGAGRKAVLLGAQKLNLHDSETGADLVAAAPTVGAIDICFLTGTPLDEVIRHLEACAVPVELGPVGRAGAQGPILSVYIRDPDGNLVEIANRA